MELEASSAEIDVIFSKVDTDCSGSIDWDEFVELISTEFYKKYMLKIIRDGIKKQRVHLKESSQELAKIGYSITEDSMLEIAKKVIQGHVSLDEFEQMIA